MGMIFNGQTALNIRATLDIDVSDCTCIIKYRKPDGEEGFFPAAIVDASNGVIIGSPSSADDLSQVGKYTFWGYITFSDGRVAAGEPEEITIYQEGRVPRN